MRLTVFTALLCAVTPSSSSVIHTEAACPPDFVSIDNRCIYIDTSVFDGTGPITYWNNARTRCTSYNDDSWSVDLISLDESILSSISAYIVANYYGMKGYEFWVGATKEDGTWMWVDGTPININSYVWYYSSPNPDRDGICGKLVPLGHPNSDRYYMYESGDTSFAPSYICEAKSKATLN